MLVWNRPALLFISLRLAAGAMGHGPEMFQTFNQQHNPLQKIWKNCKNLWSAKTRSPMGPDGPRWALWASRLKRLLLIFNLSIILCRSDSLPASIGQKFLRKC